MTELNFIKSIKFKIPIIIVIIFIIPFLCIWWINYSSTTSTVIDNSGKIIQSKLKSVSLSVESVTQNIEDIGSECINDPEMQEYITSYLNTNKIEKKTYYRSLMTIYLLQKKVPIRNISSIYVFIDDNPYVFTIDAGKKELSVNEGQGAWAYRSFKKNFNGNTGWMIFDDSPLEGSSPNLAYAVTKTFNGTGNKQCTLLFVTSDSCFSKIFSDIDTDNSDIIASDFNNLVMLSNNTSSIGTNVLKNKRYCDVYQSGMTPGWYVKDINGTSSLVVYYRSDLTFWKYCQITPITQILGKESTQISMMIWILVLGILIAIFGGFVVSKYVVSPLGILIGGMRQVENGSFPQLKIRHKNDEISLVLNGFNKMVLKLNNLINEVYVQQILRKDAQLKSIQSQIDEHFLYNTLNSIMCAANEENAENTEEMLSMLSRYFRLNLSEGKSFIKISEVVTLMKCYLSLQKIRFNTKLSIRFNVDKSVEDMYVLKYLFQPIVENAVVHGMEEYMEHITITITFKQIGQNLHFEVHNDGKIIEPDDLATLKERIMSIDAVEGNSFALKNINAQIALTYGKEYGISISSSWQNGTAIGFIIPLKDNDADSSCDTNGGN